jgi:hypothetical protein
MIRPAVPARRKVREAPEGRTFEKRRQTQLKFNSGIRRRSRRQELSLGSKKTFYEALEQTHELEVVKRAVGISIGLRKVSDWTLWKGRPPRNERRDVQSTALGKEQRRWWYTSACSHLIRELLGTSGMKEGATGVVGE